MYIHLLILYCQHAKERSAYFENSFDDQLWIYWENGFKNRFYGNGSSVWYPNGRFLISSDSNRSLRYLFNHICHSKGVFHLTQILFYPIVWYFCQAQLRSMVEKMFLMISMFCHIILRKRMTIILSVKTLLWKKK